MKLVTPNPEATLDAVRRLSEFAITAPNGRVLHCKPFVEFKAPMARAQFAIEDFSPMSVPLNRHTKRGYQPFGPYLEAFKATQPGEFRTAQLRDFAYEQGWKGTNDGVNNVLAKHVELGDVTRASYDGKFVNWRFA